ncbi:MAG: 16S rRNA (cytosine(1402)-N(4))-methyltransferase RsmH [Bryobacter sp.]|nr:16S rRNA (cytosine(1402)-N(4))-methyltransferase RsmH [Bryobacter sp.]
MKAHFPVMSREVMEFLAIRPAGRYADLTAGLGGHSRLIASLLEEGILVMNDRDGESLAMAQQNVAEYAARVRPTQGPFSTFADRLAQMGVGPLDGLLADLGVSMKQLSEPERGFSFRLDGPCDMRMDRSDEESLTAGDVVNTFSEEQLADILWEYGQEGAARAIARAIVRRGRPIRSTQHLAQVVESVVRRTSKISPATKTFMALRLFVNREMEELEALLAALPRIVAPGARVVFLTFMSTEDRIVKRAFQAFQQAGQAKILTKHVVKPSDEETRANPPSRSAKLRALAWA